MATANTFQDFVGDLCMGYHGDLDAAALRVCLVDEDITPNAATHDKYGDFTANETTNAGAGTGYTVKGELIPSQSFSETAGTGTLTGSDIVWTATGDTIDLIKYAILYNDDDTTTPDGAIAWWSYGQEIQSLSVDETFTFSIVTNIFTIAASDV